MKLLSPQQIHEWDAYTIANEPVASINLMERAARTCTGFISEQNFIKNGIKIFCGKGNNGGDGLAIARQLIETGYTPEIYILEFGAKGTDDFQINLNRLHLLTKEIVFIQSKEFFPVVDQHKDLVIDALFGSGLNRPLENLSAELVKHLNDSQATIVAIDVPSGMFIDKTSKTNVVIKATDTLTFQSLKLCFLVAENAELFGNVHVLDIGLSQAYLDSIRADELITLNSAANNYKKRKAFAHKGIFGHALLVAGNTGKMGAALLAAKACLHSGCGLVTLNIPESFLNTVHAAIPEAMCQQRENEINFTNISAIGIGPGLGTDNASSEIVLNVLQQFKKPMVIDADALSIIAQHKEWLDEIMPGSILTPHPKEFERLFGKTENDFEKIQLAKQLSEKYPFVIILKGHHTLVAFGGTCWFNTTGNTGLAKGGSGDVLTGILTSLLAQGYSCVQASVIGVYLHGLAADIAAQTIAEESMLATDIINHLSDAFIIIKEANESLLNPE